MSEPTPHHEEPERRESAVPRGMFGRARRLAGSSIKTSARIAMLGPRTILGRDSPQKLAADVYEQAATELLQTLGQLKGASMKAGQMMSFVDSGVIPAELRDVYQSVLGALRDAAPPMSQKLVEQTLRAELGATSDELFATFDPDAAAASLGQVHLATLHDGREVAVKVQYPGVDDALRADLAFMHVAKPFLPLVAPGLEGDALFDEVRRLFMEELDYEREAHVLGRLAATYEGHPFIWLPRPVPELSTGRVLVMERATGILFDEFRTYPQTERNRIAEILFRFHYGSLVRFGITSGDPHPGNYMLRPDGTMVFFDLGATVEMDEVRRALYRETFVALTEGDVQAFFDALAASGFVRDPSRVDPNRLFDWASFSLAPIRQDREYTFTREWIAEQTNAFIDPRAGWLPLFRRMNVPPHAVAQQRLDLALFAVLAQLEATGNWHRIMRELYGLQGPATQLGEAEAAWLRT